MEKRGLTGAQQKAELRAIRREHFWQFDPVALAWHQAVCAATDAACTLNMKDKSDDYARGAWKAVKEITKALNRGFDNRKKYLIATGFHKADGPTLQ